MSGQIGFEWHRSGRSGTALLALAGIWGALALLVWKIDLSPVIAGAVALFTLPALWEVITNPRSGLALDARRIAWHSTRHDDELPLTMLQSVRFDTRLDLSVRITLCLTDGRKIRLPHAATPPHRAFEQALQTLGIPTERHHFSLIG